MKSKVFRFNKEIVFNIWSGANEIISFEPTNEYSTKMAFQNLRRYIFKMNAVASIYGDGLQSESVFELADVLDNAKDLNAGEDMFIIWTGRRVSWSTDIEDFNETVRINTECERYDAECFFKANCAYRIRRTPKQFKVYHLKPIYY